MMRLVNEKEYFVGWLVFWLGAVVGGFLVGGIVGFVIGFILGMAGTELGVIQRICGIAGFIVGIPWSYFMFRVFVAKMIVEKVERKVADVLRQQAGQDVPQGV